MAECIEGEVIHVVPPDELDEHELESELQSLAESSYVLVCRRGGHRSIFGLLWAYLRRDPIEAVTVVTEQAAEEGDTISVTAEETALAGVYTTVS